MDDLTSRGTLVPASAAELAAHAWSAEEPLKVAPRHERVHGLGPAFDYTFEAFSLTILRLVPAS